MLTLFVLASGCHTPATPPLDSDTVDSDPPLDTDTDVPDTDPEPVPVDVPVVPPPDLPEPPVVPFETHARSGTRLTALAWETDEGVLAHRGFFDTMLQAECWFHQTSETTWHCLPNRGLMHTITYADATCDGIAAMRSSYPTCPPHSYETLFLPTDPACGRGTSAVFEVGPAIALPTASEAWTDIDAVCTYAGSWGGAPAFELGPPVDLDTFVAGEPVMTELEAGVYATQIHGADGSRLHRQAVTRNGEVCGPTATDAGDRCVPSTVAHHIHDGYFADAACTVPVGAGRVSTCNPDRWLASEELADGSLRLWTLGPEIPATEPLYRPVGGSCLSTSHPTNGDGIFWLSQPVDATRFPSVSAQTFGTEVQQDWMVTPSGTRVAPISEPGRPDPFGVGFIDSCDLALLDGGPDVACLYANERVDPASFAHFSDAACTELLFESTSGFLGDLAYPECGGGLPHIADARAPGPQYTGTVWRSASGGQCLQATSPPTVYSPVPAGFPTLVPVPPASP
ncbi:MAG: hypothetical protein R3F61_29535 [Myxococcota bacterium]